MEFYPVQCWEKCRKLFLYEAEKVIAKMQVEIQVEVNDRKPEKFERKYVE